MKICRTHGAYFCMDLSEYLFWETTLWTRCSYANTFLINKCVLSGWCWSQVVWHFLPLLIPIGYFLYVHCHIIRWPHLSSSLSRYRLAAPAPGLRPCIDYDGETSKVSSAREFKIVLPILHLINLPSPSNGASSWAKSGQTWILQTTIVTNTQYILV